VPLITNSFGLTPCLAATPPVSLCVTQAHSLTLPPTCCRYTVMNSIGQTVIAINTESCSFNDTLLVAAHDICQGAFVGTDAPPALKDLVRLDTKLEPIT
jgi:hypothetical protein